PRFMNTLIPWLRLPPAVAARSTRVVASLAALLAPIVILLLLALPRMALAAEETARFNFELPADAAEVALKRFSDQSGRQVVFPTEVAEGVRTSEVRGEFTPREALTRMLAGTPLRAQLNERTGAWAIVRETAPGPGPVRAAQP